MTGRKLMNSYDTFEKKVLLREDPPCAQVGSGLFLRTIMKRKRCFGSWENDIGIGCDNSCSCVVCKLVSL
jgi:hypothetical protein